LMLNNKDTGEPLCLMSANLLSAARTGAIPAVAARHLATRPATKLAVVGSGAINRACVASRTPLVSGAAIRFDGQVAVFDLRRDDAPCYHCLFAEDAESPEERCATMGIFAPLVGIVGTFQALEAIKLVAGVGETLAGRLLLFDALASRWHEVRLARDPRCRACSPARARAA